MRCNYKKSIRDKENANFTSIKIVNANPSLYFADIFEMRKHLSGSKRFSKGSQVPACVISTPH